MNDTESVFIISDITGSLGRRIRMRGQRGKILGCTLGQIKQMLQQEVSCARVSQLELKHERLSQLLHGDDQSLMCLGVHDGDTLRASLTTEAPHLVDVQVINHEARQQYRFPAVNSNASSVGDVKRMVTDVAGIPSAHQALRCDGKNSFEEDSAPLVGLFASKPKRAVLHLYRSPQKQLAAHENSADLPITAAKTQRVRVNIASPAPKPRRQVSAAATSPAPEFDLPPEPLHQAAPIPIPSAKPARHGSATWHPLSTDNNLSLATTKTPTKQRVSASIAVPLLSPTFLDSSDVEPSSPSSEAFSTESMRRRLAEIERELLIRRADM